jgi:hypothetical protein
MYAFFYSPRKMERAPSPAALVTLINNARDMGFPVRELIGRYSGAGSFRYPQENDGLHRQVRLTGGPWQY